MAMAIALLVALGLNCALIYIALGVPTRSTIWSYEINQKKLQRAASIQKPKLLLVGGSATLFGIQAELIEKTLGYPTVNMGTHAGLGIAYMLHLVQQAAKPGDTVILAFEYNTYGSGAVRRDPIFVDYLLARDPEYFRSLPLQAQFDIAMMTTFPRLRKGVRNRFKPEGAPKLTPIYHPANLNIYGDQLGNDPTNRPVNVPNLYRPDGSLMYGLLKDMAAFANIEEFVLWARSNNVRVFATYPNIMENPGYNGAPAKVTLRRIQDAYAELEVPMIGSFKDSMLPPSVFLDTCYHLTREGARQRTERLIPQLAAVLNREQK